MIAAMSAVLNTKRYDLLKNVLVTERLLSALISDSAITGPMKDEIKVSNSELVVCGKLLVAIERKNEVIGKLQAVVLPVINYLCHEV